MIPVATIKESFFDKPKVVKALAAKERRALMKGGAIIRRTAIFSMKSRKGIAPEGSPPYAHEKTIKRLLFFSYDAQEKATVVGPALSQESKNEPIPIPLLMEEGGVKAVVIHHKREQLHYGKHPFMKPALDENIPKIAPLFGGKFYAGGQV